MTSVGLPLRKLAHLRYHATCARCGVELSKGVEAWYDDADKKVVCLACGPSQSTSASQEAGSSARAEGERRERRLVERVRRQDGDYAAAVAEQLAHQEAEGTWFKGAEAEHRLAAYIERELKDTVIPLHDRRSPGRKTNIDLIWIASGGVWVVDAKAYAGKLERRDDGPIWNRTHRVFVNRRDRSSVARGVEHQLDAVLAAVHLDPQLKEIPVYGAVCFVDTQWERLDPTFCIGRVWITHPKALRKELRRTGELSRQTMEHARRRLELSLPAA
ncbi:MAG TPA: nuclease-related domain-containing protein [Polyangiaceae bacterium]|nr:nuclease-related domain-containing protein [Polyangiaceae bacterium]